MRKNKLMIFLFACVSISSCSRYYNAYIRNTTKETARVDDYLLIKEEFQTIPNQIKVSNKLVPFKSGYRKYFNNLQNVNWIDTHHFKLDLSPNTAADLTDMAGKVLNGFFRQKVLMTVTVANRTDTVLNGSDQSNWGLFQSKSRGFGTPVIFYDIK